MALLVHPGPVPIDRLMAALREHLQGEDIRVWPDIGNPADIDVALVSRIPAGVLRRLPALRLVASLHAGVNHLLQAGEIPPHVPLTRPVPVDGDVLMNEYLLTQVLFHHRQLPAYLGAQREARWARLPLHRIESRTVGFLGLGAMAAPAAALMRRVGFDVAAWTRRPRPDAAFPVFDGDAGLPALLARSEILVNLLPLTPATHGIVDAKLLAQLPRGAAFINVGRGEHVVDADLIAALDAAHLSAATLDVFREEPLPQAHPFWRHPRITVTPHACREVDVDAVVAQFADGLRRVRRGEAPSNRVDPWSHY